MMNALQAKLISQQKLLLFLSKQLQQQQALEKYYHSCLNEITGQATPQEPQFKLSPSPTKKPQRRMKTEESPSLMEQSLLSIELNKSKAEKVLKKDAFSSEMEYQQMSKEISKLLDALSGKDASFKKTIPSTPQRNKSFSNKGVVKPCQALKLATGNNFSLLSVSKTDRFQNSPQPDRQKMLSQLGDTSAMISNDEIVVNLLSHVRLQQQRFVQSMMSLTAASSTQKMRNYTVHLCEKNEQTLFKLRQKEKDVEESKLEMNRQMVRTGYTERMKQLIDHAFTSHKPFH